MRRGESFGMTNTGASIEPRRPSLVVMLAPGDNRPQQGRRTQLFCRFLAATPTHRYAWTSNLFPAPPLAHYRLRSRTGVRSATTTFCAAPDARSVDLALWSCCIAMILLALLGLALHIAADGLIWAEVRLRLDRLPATAPHRLFLPRRRHS